MVILFHGWFNFFSVSSAGVGSATVMSAVIVFWVVRTVRVYGLTNPAPAEKQVI